MALDQGRPWVSISETLRWHRKEYQNGRLADNQLKRRCHRSWRPRLYHVGEPNRRGAALEVQPGAPEEELGGQGRATARVQRLCDPTEGVFQVGQAEYVSPMPRISRNTDVWVVWIVVKEEEERKKLAQEAATKQAKADTASKREEMRREAGLDAK